MIGAGDGAEGVEARILAVAARHLRRDGLARLTVVRIAEEAGMTHANVYRYFPSKIALADRIVSDWLREIERRLGDITQAPDPADDKLERFLTLLARAYDDKSRADPAVFDVYVHSVLKGRATAGRHQQRVHDLMARVLEEGFATRVFPSGDVRRAASLVRDALHRFIDPVAIQTAQRLDGEKGGGAADPRRERVTRLIVRGLASSRS